MLFFNQNVSIFFLFLNENIYYGCLLEALTEVLLMSTHIICFCEEIRKTFIWVPLLYRTMYMYFTVFTLNIPNSTLLFQTKNIGVDKSGYQVNIRVFLVPQKCETWPLFHSDVP